MSSNSGDDSNTGNTEKDALKTIDKVNTIDFQAGSTILFKRGDSFVGEVTVMESGDVGKRIAYGAYGNGNKPKIYGSEEITEWTVFADNIYKATFDKEINQLFVDDERIAPARYPNVDEKLFTITDVKSSVTFNSSNLSGKIKYSGSSIHLRTNAWRLDGRKITRSIGNIVTLDSELPYGGIKAGMEFFLVDNLDFLDESNEWYSDGTTVYLWTKRGDNPNKHTVRGSTINAGFIADTKNYITIKNLNILQQQEAGILADNSTNVIIDSVDIHFPEERGIILKGGHNTVIDCVIEGVNYVGLSCNKGNSVITDNTIKNIGLLENLGINGIAGKSASLLRNNFWRE